jgi:hypothetical protein
MSLLLAGVILVGTSGVVAAGRWLRKRGGAAASARDAAKTKEAEAPPRAAAPERRLDGFDCQLGDVVLRVTGEEAWLAGALVLAEDVEDVAALFLAPDAVHDTAVYAYPRPRSEMWWLAPLDPKTALIGGEPLSAIEHDGIRFERVRRLPLRTRRVGVGMPDVGDAVTVVEYASAGAERLLLLKGSSGKVFCYRGMALDAGSYEIIPSGASTLV